MYNIFIRKTKDLSTTKQISETRIKWINANGSLEHAIKKVETKQGCKSH